MEEQNGNGECQRNLFNRAPLTTANRQMEATMDKRKQPQSVTEANLAMKPRERTAGEKAAERPALSRPVAVADAILDDASSREDSETEAALKRAANNDRPAGSAGGKREPE
jgi:hypothetical protein